MSATLDSDAPDTARPHVLIISYGYAPLEHVSATRSIYMAAELTALGWDVSVLTADWSSPQPDRVHTTSACVDRALSESSPRRLAIDARAFNPEFVANPSLPNTERPAPSFPPARRLLMLRNHLTTGPYRRWAQHAYRAASLLHERRPIDVTWAIHGDASCHSVAYWLKTQLGIPWVADFKDAWDRFELRLALAVTRRMTERRLATAEALTETCAAQAELDAERFGMPAHVIYSGYDRDLMENAAPEKPGEGFCLTYTGSFGMNHDISTLQSLLAALVDRKVLERCGIQVHQYSPLPQISERMQDLGAGGHAHHHPRVSRDRAFRVMRGSDLLLMFPANIEGRSRFAVGLKEIEYVATGTPVLVLGAPLDEFVDLMRNAPQVTIADNVDEAIATIEAEAARVRSGESSRRPANGPEVAKFTWPIQAQKLAQIFSDCVASAR